MKNFWLLFAAILVFSCKTEAPIDYAVISGTITNATSTDLMLMSTDRSFRKEFKLGEDGTFTDTLRVDANQFTIYEGRNATPVYANVGDNVVFSYDATDYENTLSYSGTGFETSVYLSEKNKITSGFNFQEAFMQEEADFLESMRSTKTELLDLLNGSTGVAEEFKALETKGLNYEYLGKLQMYPNYHGYFTKKEDFKVSEGFMSEVDVVDLNNEEDYAFSQDYKQMVQSKYREEASRIAEEKGIDHGIAAMEVYATVPSEFIKNELAFGAAQGSMKYADDIDAYLAAFNKVSTNEEHKNEIAEIYEKVKKVSAGQPSPRFENFENHAGGTTSLEDLKGKYVYIDVWATWCGPCKYEIPFLKEVEEQYHGKNIHFLSLSIDDQKDHDKWVNMVTDEELGGIQLLGDNAWETQFVQDYLINGIPHFILLDPDLNVVKYSAPRPSNPELVELFTELGI